MKPWEEYQQSTTQSSSESAPWLEYQQKPEQKPVNQSIIKNFGRGLIGGLEEVGLGMYQTAADAGANFSGTKKILSKIRPDLAEEFKSMTPQDISETLAGKAKEKNLQADQEGGAYNVGRLTGKVAPFLGVGTASTAGMLAGGAAAAGTELSEETGLPERLKETGKGAITSLAVGKALQGAFKTTPYVTAFSKRLLQKTVGVKPELVEAFDKAGVSPRLADITEGTRTKVFQNLVQNFPGGGKPLEEAAQRQIDDITKQIAGITKSPGGTVQQTGKRIQEGATSFKRAVENRVGSLYDKLDNFVPKEGSVTTSNLQKLSKDPVIEDVIAVGSGDTAKVVKRFNELTDEAGNISYPRLKTFRSTIGAKLQSPSLLGEERAALKRIYGAVSEDMKAAVVQEGGEKGLQAFNKANNAFARSQAFLDKNINPLIEAKTPEDVYRLALAGTKQGGSNIKGIMKGLNPTQQEFVRGTVLKQMGMATPGLQDATGEVFSPAKFLTEWNKMSPEAKSNIFSPIQKIAVENLNKAISQIKDVSKVRQSSNNLPFATWAGLGAVSGMSPIAGVGLAGGARITSDMMSNPKFVNWLAKTPEVKSATVPKYLTKLSTIAAQNPEIRDDILGYLESITVGNANAEDLTTDDYRKALERQKKEYPGMMARMDINKMTQNYQKRYRE